MPSLRRLLKKVSFAGAVYRFLKKTTAKARYKYNQKYAKVLSEDDLIKQFKEIGIYPKDRIIVNSSLSKIGFLQEGAKTVVEALKKYITEEGLLVMSTYPHTNSFNYLENYQVFEVNNTPSKNGAITEYFRKSEGVTRSIHPTHSLAAWGKDSKKLMEGHHRSESLYDTESPYKKLLDMDIKVLLIGVNFNHAVMIRIIDDLYPDYPLSPYIPNKIYEVDVLGYKDEIIRMKTPCHDPKFSKERNNMAIFPYMKTKIRFGKLGLADTWVFSSQDLFNTQVECAKKEILPFYRLPLKNRKA